MINLIRRILPIIALSLFMMCGKKFLEVPPQGSLDGSSLANRDGIFQSLVSTYSLLDGSVEAGFGAIYSSGSNWIYGSVTTDDSYTGSENGDQDVIKRIGKVRLEPCESYTKSPLHCDL